MGGEIENHLSLCPFVSSSSSAPYGVSTFFENEQRRGPASAFSFAGKLALELANALACRCRGYATLVERQAPLLVLGALHPFAFKVGSSPSRWHASARTRAF